MEPYANFNRSANARGGCAGNMGTRYGNGDCPANRNRMDKNMNMPGVQARPVGIAYVPMQTFGELYEACKGLKEGTMFPELNLIFCGVRGN